MITSGRNTVRIDPRQQFERHRSLGVLFTASGGCVHEGSEHIILGHAFKLMPTRNRILRESRAEVSPQRLTVRKQPSLHCLNHQERLIVSRTRRSFPTVVLQQVPPDSVSRNDWRLAVDKKQRRVAGPGTQERIPEQSKRPPPRTAAYDPRNAAPQTRCLEELCPGASEETLEILVVVPASLDVDANPDTHQRFPPSSPDPHRSPRL